MNKQIMPIILINNGKSDDDNDNLPKSDNNFELNNKKNNNYLKQLCYENNCKTIKPNEIAENSFCKV